MASQNDVPPNFSIPPSLLGRFGVIKLWPDIQVAEDEVIARLVNTAKLVGLECVILDHMGRDLRDPGEPLTGRDLDFVIHLHFSTPKSYDVFSFVTLWNPTSFFHDFGYRPTAENILTHDDYLSCRSPGADRHLRRLIHGDPTHLPPKFELFHSLATPILAPDGGEWTIFYMGINWERLGGDKSRHGSVLELLDDTGMLRIYGPDELRGVKVWDGFQSYQRPLPFDGVSVIEEIHRAGICLALSSVPHKDASLMSNRLFEGLAAGALIICDENPWARTHFGDTLRYVDLRDDAETVVEDIAMHVRWARANPAEALALATRAQEIFKSVFIMSRSLGEIYAGLPARKQELKALWLDKAAGATVRVVCLAPDMADPAFDRQIKVAASAARQGFQATLLVDRLDFDRATAQVGPLSPGIEIRSADFFQRNSAARVVMRNRLGSVLWQEFLATPDGTLLCFVAPNETIFEDHLAMLAGTLHSGPELDYVWAKAIIHSTDGLGEQHFAVERNLDLLSDDPAAPIGLGRFMFRAGAFAPQLEYLLESLDTRAASGLALYAAGGTTQRASLVIDVRGTCHAGIHTDAATDRKLGAEVQQDLEAIRDLDALRFDTEHRRPENTIREGNRRAPENEVLEHKILMPNALYLDHLSRANLRGILLRLLGSLPMPGVVRRVLAACLRGVRRVARMLRERG